MLLETGSNMGAVSEIFQEAREASNMKVNLQKSIAIPIGEVQEQNIDFQILPVNGTVRILGFIFTRTGIQSAEIFWPAKLEEIKRKAESLNAKQYIMQGRILLKNSLILSKAAFCI